MSIIRDIKRGIYNGTIIKCIIGILILVGIVSLYSDRNVIQAKRIDGHKVAVMLNEEGELCLAVKEGFKYNPKYTLVEKELMYTSYGEVQYQGVGGRHSEKYITRNYDVLGRELFRVNVFLWPETVLNLGYYFQFIEDELCCLVKYQGMSCIVDADGDDENELLVYRPVDGIAFADTRYYDADLIVYDNEDGNIITASVYDTIQKKGIELQHGKIESFFAQFPLVDKRFHYQKEAENPDMNIFPFEGVGAEFIIETVSEGVGSFEELTLGYEDLIFREANFNAGDVLEIISVDNDKIELFLDEYNNVCLSLKSDKTGKHVLIPNENAFDDIGEIGFSTVNSDTNPSRKYMTDNYSLLGKDCFKATIGVNHPEDGYYSKSFYFTIDENGELEKLLEHEGRGYILDFDGDDVNEFATFEYDHSGEEVPDLILYRCQDDEVQTASVKELFEKTMDISEYHSIDEIYMKIYDGSNKMLLPGRGGLGGGVFPIQGQYIKMIVEYTTELDLSGSITFSYEDLEFR